MLITLNQKLLSMLVVRVTNEIGKECRANPIVLWVGGVGECATPVWHCCSEVYPIHCLSRSLLAMLFHRFVAGASFEGRRRRRGKDVATADGLDRVARSSVSVAFRKQIHSS